MSAANDSKSAAAAATERDTVKVSVIVPAYKEVGNLPALIDRVFAAFADKAPSFRAAGDSDSDGEKRRLRWDAEMIIVDDNSRDGSEEAVNAKAKAGANVRIIVRTNERGLSSAVLKGFAESKGDFLLCMDADLQHPPEMVPDLLSALAASTYSKRGVIDEFVLGTRYGKGVAIDKDWPLYRQVISKGARMLAQPLTPLSDPMTGFFGLTRRAYERGLPHINPIGFKIAMECYVKCGITHHVEVPFSFGVRVAGHSKLETKVVVQYLKHLNQLYTSQHPVPYLLFWVLLIIVAYWVLNFARRLLF